MHFIHNYRAIRARFFPPPPPVRITRSAPPPPAPEPTPQPEPAQVFRCLAGADIPELLRTAAEIHGVRVDDIKSHRRLRPIVLARRMACALLCEYTSLSYPRIGSIIGLDHTSVYLAVKRWDQTHGTRVLAKRTSKP